MLVVDEENTIAMNENSVEVNKYVDVTQWKLKKIIGEGREEDAFMIALINILPVYISPGLESGRGGRTGQDWFLWIFNIYIF